MTDITIKLLSEEINIPVDFLIKNFSDIGINKTITDTVNQRERKILLAYLCKNHNIVSDKLILHRKIRNTLNIPNASGKIKSVQIEIRKKYTYITHFSNKKEKFDHVKLEKKIELTHLLPKPNNIQSKEKEIIHNKILFLPIISEKNFSQKQQDSYKNQHVHVNQSLKSNQKHSNILKDIKKIRILKENIVHQAKEKTQQIRSPDHDIAAEYKKELENQSFLLKENIVDNRMIVADISKTVQEKNSVKIEENNRIRNRIYKSTKNKKIHYLSEDHNYPEAGKMVHRINKNKRKSTSLVQQFSKPTHVMNRDIILGGSISISELANKMAVKGSKIIKTIMKLGSMATINQILDQETAKLIAEEMGHRVILRHENELEKSILSHCNTNTNLETRAPIVTVMGHVNHGKTSLLDCIRSTKVASCEVGHITQHIGAYHVNTNQGNITFLDTPGHSAFTAMRVRGTKITDIVILVVAADDGVMPQTIEAIQHAKAAKVSIIVAINKIDKSEADPEKIKHELAKHGILPEEWGGEYQFILVSAKSGIGIDKLLHAITLQAEILELKSIHHGIASGVVIESYLDKNRGPIITALIQDGTLRKGDIILCGCEWGRVRAMRNEIGDYISSAGPSLPVEVLGISGIPRAGDVLTVVHNEKKAREVALYRQGKFRETKLSSINKYHSHHTFDQILGDKYSIFNIILKSDVQGTAEVIMSILENLSTNEVKINIIGSGVGNITETDATLAVASNATLLGFNIKADISAQRIIASENLNVYYYSIIYDLIHDINNMIYNLSSPKYKENIIGIAEIRDIFTLLKYGTIAGCMVTQGIIRRNSKIHIFRKKNIIYEGEVESLRRFKEDVSEVRVGMECGIGIKNYPNIQLGDTIQAFSLIITNCIVN